jgi:lipopolysaccharide biosynthesis glycosyltransferase
VTAGRILDQVSARRRPEVDGTLHVACAADGAYVPHCATMLHSVLAQRGGLELSVHYLHGPGLAASSRDALARMVERGSAAITFHEIPDAAVAGLPLHGYFTPAMWYRILAPELLGELDRVLYLDADTLAVDSVAPLWDVDLDGAIVAAVTNVPEPQHADRPRKLGLPESQQYFNSGVLLMDLAAMRREDSAAALREYARTAGIELIWPDQDAYNVVLGARRLALHPRWNCMNSIMEFESSVDVFGSRAVAEARTNPAIRHFEGPGLNKPWNYMCDRALRDEYLVHRRQTPWPRCRFEDATLANRGRRLVRRVRGLRRRALQVAPR